MRIEATISDARGEQLQQLADELHISKSQLVEEALSVFQKAVLELKRGRRLAIVEADLQRTVCEVASPSLTQLEWASHREQVIVPPEGLVKAHDLMRSPPAPSESLKKAFVAKKKRAK
jgi:hypothetical protein